MNHERHTGGFGDVHDLDCREPVGCDWFLADDGDLPLDSQAHQRQMGFDARHNIHEVEWFAVEHLIGGTVDILRELFGAIQTWVRRGDNLDFGDAPPSLDMTPGEEAAADDAASQDASHSGPAWARRRSQCTWRSTAPSR